MLAAQKPLELLPTESVELVLRLISTLPPWAIAVIVTVVILLWGIPRLFRAFDRRRMVKKACATKEGALEALRITQSTRWRSLPRPSMSRGGDRPSPAAPENE